MQLFTTAAELRAVLSLHRQRGQITGFVPTMGALHEGHLALLSRSKESCDLTVASVFVNPTQFDRPADLRAYPRTPERDEALLRAADCDYVYRPEVADVYPRGAAASTAALYDFGSLTERMEGALRPGHFAGVAQVVSRLLQIVQPDRLFLGQKDYQQVAVIRRLIELLGYDLEVVTVPTVREADGLAMSSRNRRLSGVEREAAGSINLQLAAVVAGLRCGWPARQLERLAMEAMAAVPLLKPEYVEVVDGITLLPYQDGQAVTELVVATAVYAGQVRLIDNRIARTANP